YRMQHSELLLDRPLYYGDVIQLEPRRDGDFVFVRRTARALLRRTCFLMTRAQADSPELESFLAAVTAGGGIWEVWFHGIVLIHRPRECGLDPLAEWQRIFQCGPVEG